MSNGAKFALSRMWFAVDVGLGRVAGNACPNCAAKPAPGDRAYEGRYGLFSVWSCAGCGLLYRPVAFSQHGILHAYYTDLYANADIATDIALANDPVALRERIVEKGKHRVALVESVLGDHDPAKTTLCIFGCSWGYELLPFRERGYTVAGIELGSVRREHGKKSFGLTVYETPEEAARAGLRPDVVLSSHVLEHIPKLESLLDTIDRALSPRVQIHVTPHVDAFGPDPSLRTLIGRDHPLGVVRPFWEHYGASRNLDVACHVADYAPGRNCGELVAVLRRRATAM